MTIYSSDYSSSSGGSSVLRIQNVSSDGLVNDWNYCILADATTAQFTITLPTSIGNDGKQIEIIKTDNSANVVVVVPFSGQSINGSVNSIYLYNQNDSVVIRSDGVNSYIVADNRNSVGQSKSYLQVSIQNTSTNFPSVGSAIVFSTINNYYGTDISCNTSTGVFTLKSGKTYRLTGNVSIISGTEAIYQWRDITNNALFGVAGNIINGTPFVRNTEAEGIITPISDITVRLESRTNISAGTMGSSANRYPYVYIEVISTPANVINTVDYIFARVASNVTTTNTIIPVSPVVGNIGVSNNMFSLKVGNTYELEAFIESNGNTGSTWLEYIWTDSSGIQLPNSNTGLSVPVQATSTDSSILAKAIITPTQNMSVKVMTTSTVAGVIGLALTRSYFKISQIGSTAQTGFLISQMSSAYAHFNRPYDGNQFVSGIGTGLVTYPLNVANQKVLNGITFSDSGDSLTINVSGTYKISFIQYGNSGASGYYAHEASIFINGSTVAKGSASAILNRITNTVEYVNTLSAGDVITFKVQGVGDNSDIMGGSVSIQQIS